MFFRQQLKNFLNTFCHVMNVKTNQYAFEYMSETNTPKTLVCTPLIRFYKMLLCFALGPLVSEILKNKVFFLACFWTNYFSWLLDQLVQRVATKKNATRVLHGLDSTHGKCYYWGGEECFSGQWCYISASMRLLLQTLVKTNKQVWTQYNNLTMNRCAFEPATPVRGAQRSSSFIFLSWDRLA